MKELVLATFLLFAGLMLAVASEWPDFDKSYQELSIYEAVEMSLALGRTPWDITEQAMSIKGMSETHLMAALYCADVSPEDIYLSAEETGIVEENIVLGFSIANVVCGDAIADAQAYTPVAPSVTVPPGSPPRTTTYASPSSF